MSLRTSAVAGVLALASLCCKAGNPSDVAARKPSAVTGATSSLVVSAQVPIPTPSAVPAIDAAPRVFTEPPSTGELGVERLIVWGEPEDAGGAESFWLERRPPKLEVRGRRAGALTFASGGVYRFHQTKGIGHGLRDCTSVFLGAAPSPSDRFTIEVAGASAKRVDADGEIVISPPEAVEDASSYENAVTLEASIGPLLFVSEWADFMYCTAAHPGSSSSSYLYDLDKRQQVPFPTKPDIEALRSSARALPEQTSRVCLEISVTEGSGDKPSLDALYLDLALPRWTPKRGLHTELGFGIMRSYVEGLKTCRIEVAGLPPSLDAVRVPAAFAELPRKLGRFGVRGWSSVPPGEEANAALERAFLRKGKR